MGQPGFINYTPRVRSRHQLFFMIRVVRCVDACDVTCRARTLTLQLQIKDVRCSGGQVTSVLLSSSISPKKIITPFFSFPVASLSRIKGMRYRNRSGEESCRWLFSYGAMVRVMMLTGFTGIPANGPIELGRSFFCCGCCCSHANNQACCSIGQLLSRSLFALWRRRTWIASHGDRTIRLRCGDTIDMERM
jgi:hypothetical protein